MFIFAKYPCILFSHICNFDPVYYQVLQRNIPDVWVIIMPVDTLAPKVASASAGRLLTAQCRQRAVLLQR